MLTHTGPNSGGCRKQCTSTTNNKIISDSEIKIKGYRQSQREPTYEVGSTVIQSTMLLPVGNPSTAVDVLLHRTGLASGHASRCHQT